MLILAIRKNLRGGALAEEEVLEVLLGDGALQLREEALLLELRVLLAEGRVHAAAVPVLLLRTSKPCDFTVVSATLKLPLFYSKFSYS